MRELDLVLEAVEEAVEVVEAAEEQEVWGVIVEVEEQEEVEKLEEEQEVWGV